MQCKMEIVPGVFDGKIGALLGKIGALLDQGYAQLPFGVGDVRFLHDELVRMRSSIPQCLLLDSPVTSDWANCFCEFANDIEDWVDLFPLRVHPDSSGGGERKPPSSRLLRWLRRRDTHNKLTMLPDSQVIAGELQTALKVRIVKLRDVLWQLHRWQPVPTVHASARRLPSFPASHDPHRDLVGLERPIEEVSKMVMDAGDKAQLKIVSIVGMAGSGKTTLANAVYKRLNEQNLFQFQAFMSVGHKPHLTKTLVEMLSKLPNGHQEDYGRIRLLDDSLRQRLKKERYLIVLDDLWSEVHLQIISRHFPENYLGSRIITTTRNVAVATEFGCIYNIGLLSENDSRKLILNRAFGTAHHYPYELEDIFPKITSRCGGLPLALVTLASILRDPSSMGEWERLIGSRWLSISDPDVEVMKQVLSLSYNDLSPNLQIFMLHLSIFPENYDVDTERIVRRMIGERYMINAPGTTVEETARSCLDELINRNMVQPLHLIDDVVPRYFRLHPVIHDFIVIKSMEEKFVTLVDDQNPDLDNGIVRRLSIQSSNQDQDLARNGLTNLSHVRSITVFGQPSAAPRLTDLSLVRVLDLEGCNGPVCLECLNNLALLRYLSLRGTDVSELPAALWELMYLETLDVRSTKVKELPRSIVRLRNTLKTLLFGHEGTINSAETATRIAGDIQHCGRLENLGTTDLREHHASFVKGLGALDSLRMISIIWSFQQCTDAPYREALLSSMEKWSQLESLTIHCGFGCSMEFFGSLPLFRLPVTLQKFKVTEGRFADVPPWIKDLVSLFFLQIIVCKLGADDLKILGDLPNLQVLILGLDFVPREVIVIEGKGFNELQRFSVNCPAPWLTFRAGAMPKLTHLQLEFCSGSASEESVPYGIGNLQRLREVALVYNQKWCANSSSVKRTVEAVKRQVSKHRNLINFTINGTKVDVVREVDEEIESVTEIQSGDVQGQQDSEETVRTTIKTW